MATYVGDLITEARRDTDNVEFSAATGISTEDILRYFNYGLQRIQALIIQSKSKLFWRTQDFNITAGQSQYTISDNVYLRESIIDVRYSPTGQEQDFYELREISESYRSDSPSSRICAYYRRSGSIFVTPPPLTTQGKLRVIYERSIDKLDLRRGTLDAITVAAGAITANTISLDVASDDDTRISGVTDKYLCIVDKDGIAKARNVTYTSYSNVSGNFTHPAYTLQTGETGGAVGDFATIGKYTTTHLVELDSPNVERYLQLYANVKLFRRDSSTDSGEAARELAAVETEILEAYQDIDADEAEIQIDDPDILFLNS